MDLVFKTIQSVPAILYHEVCDTVDRFGRISVSLEMVKERIRNSSTILQSMDDWPLSYASLSQGYNLTLTERTSFCNHVWFLNLEIYS